MNIMVHGIVPKAAGMSSSSAMVCAAALATAYLNGCEISRVSHSNTIPLEANDLLRL